MSILPTFQKYGYLSVSLKRFENISMAGSMELGARHNLFQHFICKKQIELLEWGLNLFSYTSSTFLVVQNVYSPHVVETDFDEVHC